MWTSLGKSIGDFVEERLTSPLISSFVLAWIGVNYKFFVLLFSKNTASETFRLIEQFCFPDWQSRLVQGFFLPLVLALIYLYVLPIPARKVYGHWRGNLRKTDEIKLEHEINKRLTVEESREIKKRVNDLEIEIDKSNQTVRTLRAELQAQYNLNGEVAELKNEVAHLKDRLTSSEEDLKEAKTALSNSSMQFQQTVEAFSQYKKTVRSEVAELETLTTLTFTDLMNLKSFSEFKSALINAEFKNKAAAEDFYIELASFENSLEQELTVSHDHVVEQIKQVGERPSLSDSFQQT